jgi:hypothetical protein
MESITAILAIINRTMSLFNAVNKQIFKGKLSAWLATITKTALTNAPTWLKKLKAKHARHFYLMNKFNPKNKKPDRLTNRHLRLFISQYVYC